MAVIRDEAIHQAALAAWRNLTGYGKLDFPSDIEKPEGGYRDETGAARLRIDPTLRERLSPDSEAKQRARTPRLIGTEGDPTAVYARPPLQVGRVFAIPLSKDAVGAVPSPATFGPLSFPFVVQAVSISTNIARTAPSDGLVIAAVPSDFGVASLEDNLIGSIVILGGAIDAAGTQFYAPGPTGQTAYFAPNIIVPEPGWFLRACGKDTAAGGKQFGVLLQIGVLSPDDIALSFVPTITPEVVMQRTYQAAPLPRPREPVYPRAVKVSVSAGTWGAASRIVPLRDLDPALAQLAIDPVTGEWRGTNQLQAIW